MRYFAKAAEYLNRALVTDSSRSQETLLYCIYVIHATHAFRRFHLAYSTEIRPPNNNNNNNNNNNSKTVSWSMLIKGSFVSFGRTQNELYSVPQESPRGSPRCSTIVDLNTDRSHVGHFFFSATLFFKRSLKRCLICLCSKYYSSKQNKQVAKNITLVKQNKRKQAKCLIKASTSNLNLFFKGKL